MIIVSHDSQDIESRKRLDVNIHHSSAREVLKKKSYL